MSIAVGALMILAIAAAIASPFLTPRDENVANAPHTSERFERDKHAALLAIKEAEFDHAMGKLSEPDYTALREVYEERALGAMAQLDGDRDRSHASAETTPASGAAFCTGCGTRFAGPDHFCKECGAARHPSS